jgi:hypothetical protein
VYKKLEKECEEEDVRLKQPKKTPSPSVKVQKSPKMDNYCDKWIADKTHNPKTGRAIKAGGPVYKKLEKECEEEDVRLKQPKKTPSPSVKVQKSPKMDNDCMI